MSIYCVSIPIGYALGYSVGGILSDETILSNSNSWRLTFFGEAAVMVPLIFTAFCILKGPKTIVALNLNPPVYVKFFVRKFPKTLQIFLVCFRSSTTTKYPLLETPSSNEENETFCYKLGQLLHNRMFVLLTFSYTCTMFVVGGFSVFVPKYLHGVQ